MESVGIRDLKRDTSAIIKKVREQKETVEVTFRGQVVAKIVPVETEAERRERLEQTFKKMDELTERISRSGGDSSESNLVARLRDERQRVLDGDR